MTHRVARRVRTLVVVVGLGALVVGVVASTQLVARPLAASPSHELPGSAVPPGVGLPAGWAALARGSTRAVSLRTARRLFARIVVPPGAIAARRKPAGDDHLLGAGSFPVTAHYVVLVKYWVLRSSYASVSAFVNSHPPRGLTWDDSGYAGGPGIPENMSVSVNIIRSAIIGALDSRGLAMNVVQLKDGSVGLSASTMAAWVPARPASSEVPRGARDVDIRVFPDSESARTISSLEVSQAKHVGEIASMINGLPTVPREFLWNCPPTIDQLPGHHVRATSVSLTFRAGPDGPALARAAVTASATAFPTSCNPMTMSVSGHPQPDLLGGAAVVAGVDRLLHVRLSRPQP